MANLPEKSEIQRAINEYRSQRAISQNELATILEVSTATLSKIENGLDWEGIKESMWRKIWNKVKPSDPSSKILETANFAAIQKLCLTARENHLMVAVTGDTGLGKSTAIEAYSRRKNVFYVAYDKTMKPKQFFEAVTREMGIAMNGTIHEMVNRIAAELNTLENPMLIIDEAGKLTSSMFLYLHVLRDKTRTAAGILLAGMPYFKANVEKAVQRQKEGMPEFYRRVNIWHELQRPTKTEKSEICRLHGITEPETIKRLIVHQDYGNLVNSIMLEKIMLNQL